jgi:RND family efflux transporter MFP subunit
LELTGNAQAVKTVQLVARVSGFLEKVLFQDGQFVKEGQLLLLIQQNTYQESLRQAEASILQIQSQLEYAQAQLNRYSNLVQRDAAAKSELDNWQYQKNSALANLKAAEAQRALAALNLGYTEIKSPFDGRIDRRLVDPGNLVGSGSNTVLAQISQIDPIYVYFSISDSDLARLMERAGWSPNRANGSNWPVLAGFPGDKGYPHRGLLDFAATSLTPNTGTLLLRGILPNKSGKIIPGMYAQIQIPLDKKRALVVPDEAVSYDQLSAYVFIVNKENKVERRNIEPGSLSGDMRVVSKGLDAAEWVAIQGSSRLAPGLRVSPVKKQQSQPRKQARR